MHSRENDPAAEGQSAQKGTAHAVSAKPAPGPFAIGEVVGGAYKILAYLGQGGMGFVYRVEHLVMARVLALKVLRSDQVSATAWRRFQTEAQAIARLEHTNIVKIYDMNHSESGLPYYTMDLLTGESLADLLERKEILSVKEALPIFRQVCAGLAYAHDRGITHRDIKPANIMLLPPTSKNASGAVVKIVDFGIAKLSSLDGSTQQGLTKPGEVFGSPLYMSPEQCSGRPVDHRTDVYSVGITFFEALTGRTPFVGRTAVETTMMHQMEDPPDLSDYADEEFSLELERIVAKLLQKLPQDRYQSLAQTASELLTLERSTSSSNSLKAVPPGASAKSTTEPRPGNKATARQTTDNDDFSQTRTVKSSKQNWKIIASSSLFLLITSALAVAALLYKAAPPVQKAAEPLTKAVSGENSSAVFALYEAEAGHGKPSFSTIEIKDDEKIRHFEFPKTVSIGSLSYWNRNKMLNLQAQGTIEIPANEDIQLLVSGGTIQYPAILKRFQNGDLTVFQNKSFDGNNEIVRNISHITSLRKVEIPGNEIDNGCLAALSKLTKLESLDLSDTRITGAALANTAMPKQLRHLNFKNNLEVSALLDAMRNSKNAERLTLEGTHLRGHDMQCLSTMPNLDSLSLSNNNELKDNDLTPLIKLKKLKSLDLRKCRHLTAASIDTYKQMPQLVKLYLTIDDYPATLQDALRKALPGLILKTAKDSVVEVKTKGP